MVFVQGNKRFDGDKGQRQRVVRFRLHHQPSATCRYRQNSSARIQNWRSETQDHRSDHSADYPSSSSHVLFPRRHSPSASEAKTFTHMPPPWRRKQNSRSGNENVGHIVPKPRPSLSADFYFMTGSHKGKHGFAEPLVPLTVYSSWKQMVYVPSPISLFHTLYLYSLSERLYTNINVVHIVSKTKINKKISNSDSVSNLQSSCS